MYFLSSEKATITKDLERWHDCCQISHIKKSAHIRTLVFLILNFKEFRNVFLLRCGILGKLLLYLPKEPSLHIYTKSKDFGAGTFIQHGFSTIITADHIGENCWINQQVTIGFNNSRTRGFGKPWIGDNVRISAGAKVCGPIKIGSNATIGLNAVVVKDVPENSIIIPSPMQIKYPQENTFSKF